MALQESEQHEAFRGKSTHKVDSKGRVSIPADFRKILEVGDPDREPGATASTVIVYGPPQQECLLCYSLETINKLDRLIMWGNLPQQKKRVFQHYFLTSSVRAQLDPNGRISMSADLRERSRLDVNAPVRFAGTGTHFEIWNPALHDAYAVSIDDQLKSLAGPDAESFNISILLDQELQNERSQSNAD